MGTPTAPRPVSAPPPADPTKAMLNAIAYAETEKKLRASSGRKSTFLTAPSGSHTLLGQ